MSVYDEITFEDLDSDQKELAETIGIDNYKKLLVNYSGLPIYIPKIETIIKPARNERIRGEFNGGNYRRLAIKYNLTEVHIRNIVKEIDKEMKAKPIDGQIGLF